MQIPGTESRTKEDRDCTITCQCGHVLMTLRPGQRAILSKGGRKAETTCPKCGRKTSVRGASDGG